MDWFTDHAELVAFAAALNSAGAFSDTGDVVRFFEKPWKWTEEHTRWVDVGRPAYEAATWTKWDVILGVA